MGRGASTSADQLLYGTMPPRKRSSLEAAIDQFSSSLAAVEAAYEAINPDLVLFDVEFISAVEALREINHLRSGAGRPLAGSDITFSKVKLEDDGERTVDVSFLGNRAGVLALHEDDRILYWPGALFRFDGEDGELTNVEPLDEGVVGLDDVELKEATRSEALGRIKRRIELPIEQERWSSGLTYAELVARREQMNPSAK